MKTSIIASVIAFVAQATALGINCEGSSNCRLVSDARMQAIHDGIAKQAQNTWWRNGQHIYCQGQFCAFYQNIGSQLRTSADALSHVQNLLNHGCKVCGSDPVNPGNDVSTGELTVNYVTNP